MRLIDAFKKATCSGNNPHASFRLGHVLLLPTRYWDPLCDGASAQDAVIGKLTIPVKDVVRNGSLKDIYTLQDTERGQIELSMAWQTCYVVDS